MEKQKCIKCGKVKEINKFEYQKNRTNPRRKCKKCRNLERVYTEEDKIKRRLYAEKQRNEPGYFDKQKNLSLIRNYGITLFQFNKMLKKQKNKCPICSSEFKNSKTIHVDHNHSNLKVRELLCSNCNAAIGMFKEDINVLKMAIRYIIKHK